MIYDNIKNAGIYYGLSESISKGLKYLETADFSAMEDGRHDIDSDRMYITVSTYAAKDLKDAKPEAHKNYIDIQYVISGNEMMGFASLNDMELNLEISKPDRDLYYYKGNVTFLPLPEKSFMILYPQDVHAPSIAGVNPGQVRKAVLKIRL